MNGYSTGLAVGLSLGLTTSRGGRVTPEGVVTLLLIIGAISIVSLLGWLCYHFDWLYKIKQLVKPRRR